jgi:monoamine oxidase
LPEERAISQCDVAVVGAGIAGTYAAWQLSTLRVPRMAPGLGELAEANGGRLRVALFESSQRIGGRLFSVSLPGLDGVKGELGGMRFTNAHHRVMGLVNHFGLRFRPFRVADPENRNLYYLRGQHFSEADWSRPDFVPPYRLERGERIRSPGSLLIEAALRHQPQLAMYPERYRNVGFWNLLLEEYSDQAYHLIRDAGGYESLVGNWSAADAIPFLLADFAQGLEYFALEAGFQALPCRIASAFEQRGGRIITGHMLARIDRGSDADKPSLRLTFNRDGGTEPEFPVPAADRETVEVTARHVVLALPRRAIEMLHPDSVLFISPRVVSDIGTVLAQPAFKIFACYARPWWRATRGIVAGRTVTDLPVRQCYYWVTGAERRGDVPWVTGAPQPPGSRGASSALMASYNDGTSVEFWKGLVRNTDRYAPPAEVCPPGVAVPLATAGTIAPAALVNQLQRQLRELHGLSSVDDPRTADLIAPYFAVCRDWTEDPFGGGWHFWKIGVDSERIRRRMQRPYPDLPLYICGEAWCAQQGWVEGALESADEMLQRHLLRADAGEQAVRR